MRQRTFLTLLTFTCAVHAKPSHVTRTPKKARTSHLHNKKKSLHEQGLRRTQDQPTPTYQKLLGGLGITALLFLTYKAASSQQEPPTPLNQQSNTQQPNNIAQRNQTSPPNQPNNTSANSQPNNTPEPPKKTSYTLTKADINTFYNLNQAYFDLDQLIKAQKQNNKDWQLDNDKMDQWVARMQNAWQDLSDTEKKTIKGRLQNRIPEKEKKAYQADNILHLFAQYYKDKLIENFVTWDQFKDQVKNVAQDTVDKMQEQAWQDIFFLVPGGMEKSNPWIFFVFWKYLKDHIPNNATCHFISPEYIGNMNFDSKGVTSLLQGTSYKAPTSLVFIFDDMSYSGTQMRIQLKDFERHGYPPHLHVIMPYLTHRAKRQMTGMDPSHVSNQAYYYNKNYVNGARPHTNYKTETEKTWFQKSPVQFMPSTQVIQEILIEQDFLGTREFTTTPTTLPFKMADHASILCAVIAYGIYPMKGNLTQAEVDQFEPMSFFKDHAYTPDEKQKIREEILTPNIFFSDDSDDDTTPQKSPKEKTFSLFTPLELPNDLLPIKALYKNRTFTFKVKENNTIVEKQYSNTKELKGDGVFAAIKDKLSGT